MYNQAKNVVSVTARTTILKNVSTFGVPKFRLLKPNFSAANGAYLIRWVNTQSIVIAVAIVSM